MSLGPNTSRTQCLAHEVMIEEINIHRELFSEYDIQANIRFSVLKTQLFPVFFGLHFVILAPRRSWIQALIICRFLSM